MVIHGLLVTCLDQLALIFNCLKWCFVCVGLKNVLKRGQCGGNLCNDPCWDVYKDVCLLKRFSFVFESCFESVVMCDFCNLGKCFVLQVGSSN